MLLGREEIYTDVEEITRENVCNILRDAMAIHEKNSAKMDFLLNYEKGVQPIERVKKYCTDIICLYSDNDPYVRFEKERGLIN